MNKFELAADIKELRARLEVLETKLATREIKPEPQILEQPPTAVKWDGVTKQADDIPEGWEQIFRSMADDLIHQAGWAVHNRLVASVPNMTGPQFREVRKAVVDDLTHYFNKNYDVTPTEVKQSEKVEYPFSRGEVVMAGNPVDGFKIALIPIDKSEDEVQSDIESAEAWIVTTSKYNNII